MKLMSTLRLPGCRVRCLKVFLASNVSARCKRCDFCFYLNVTLDMLFFSCSQTTDEKGPPSKCLVNIYNSCSQISSIFHPLYCAAQFLRIFVTMCMWRLCKLSWISLCSCVGYVWLSVHMKYLLINFHRSKNTGKSCKRKIALKSMSTC